MLLPSSVVYLKQALSMAVQLFALLAENVVELAYGQILVAH